MLLAELKMPARDTDGTLDSLAVQQMFYETLRRGDETFATTLHDSNQQKPYTAYLNSNLRVTTLTQQVFNAFVAGADGQATVVKATTFQELVSPARSLRFKFVTPTAFKRGGKKFHLMPDPQTVFGSLRSQWRRFSPVPIGDLKYRDIIVQWCNIKQARQPLQQSGRKFILRGFIGTVEYRCLDKSQEITFGALGRFAEFAGLGMRTGMGMGVVKVE